jgi:hypothetical protein
MLLCKTHVTCSYTISFKPFSYLLIILMPCQVCKPLNYVALVFVSSFNLLNIELYDVILHLLFTIPDFVTFLFMLLL